ncbi:hypothetical protein ACQCX2_07775 [Propionibacteriaceae bacterium Y1700]|uniref:hypothetical protein n=1 Tax=Microlunatus sp. Y1700 TaxID=3418487 RepID=UPI003DA78D2B
MSEAPVDQTDVPDVDPTEAPDVTDTPDQEPTDDGKGGKAAVLADLARERDKRQALETEFAQFRDSLGQALGVKPKAATPEQLAEQLTAAHGERDQARLELAVLRGAAANGADPDALLDSASFTRTLAGLDPADSDAIGAAIKAAVESSDRYRTKTTPAAGARDANAATQPFTDADASALRVLGF